MSFYIYILIAIIILIAAYLLYKYYFKKPPIIMDNVQENFIEENKQENIDISKGNPYFIISIDGKEEGKLKFELFDDDVPKTCANFRYLCAKGLDDRKEPCYNNSFCIVFISNLVLFTKTVEIRKICPPIYYKTVSNTNMECKFWDFFASH